MTIKCPKCQSENPHDSKFCGECGAPLKPSSVTKTFQSPPRGRKKNTVIAGKYKIIEQIGEGGMGVVYKAKDIRLDREVALKFLPSEMTRDKEAKQRFLQEARAAASLDHPNICTIHEVDEADDQTFIAMSYIQGQNLKDKLNEGPLDIDEAKDMALQVAEGLKEAHEKGIIHRDIKPANIMLTEKGQAKITDFGLAKLSWGIDLTKTSTVMGTAAYMSPEQARGDKVDHRTDVWSLGAMFYEMLSGKRPFQRDQEQASIFAVINDKPTPLSLIRTDISAHIENVIEKAMAKKADQRYRKVSDFIQDLMQSQVDSPSKSEKSIIVLPFENISPDPDQEYFSDGLTEEIITDLSHIHDLLVISRSSAMTFKGSKKKISEIAGEVKVRYVLEGSVRKAGNNLRITAQLIDAEKDVHLWAEKYAGTLDDIFMIQENVSRLIADALKITLNADEKSWLRERPIENVYAYDCYLQARRQTMSFTRQGLDTAQQLLEKAMGFTGENAAIYAGLAFTHFQYANMGIEQEDNIQQADMLIEKALAVDPEGPDAHFVLGCMNMVFQGDIVSGLRHLKQAYHHRPGDTDLMQWLSWLYAVVGKTEEAMVLADRCIEIDPLNSGSVALKGLIYFMQGRFHEAQEPVLQFQKISADSNMWNLWAALVLTYTGRRDAACELIDTHVDEKEEEGLGKLCLSLKYALSGDIEALSGLLDAAFEKAVQTDCQYSWHMAAFYSFLGEKKEALKWLQNAVERGFINYPFLKYHDRLLDAVRQESGFKALMKRVKKEWENFEVQLMTEKRKLAAVMFTDIAGYTAMMEKDEQKALSILEKNRTLQKSLAKKHNGEFLKEMGDGTLLCFSSALDAVRCALAIQESVKDEPDLNLCIGIHLGDIVFKDGDVFGDGVNVASRIEKAARPGTICFSAPVYESIKNKPGIRAEYLEPKHLKHIQGPLNIFIINAEPITQQTDKKKNFEGNRKPLNWKMIIPACIVITAALFILLLKNPFQRPDGRLDETWQNSVAVLPFSDLSPQSDQEYFCEGMMDDIILKLSHVSGLRVPSRTSVLPYKSAALPLEDIGRKLNVNAVLEGSIQKDNDQIRVRVKLVDVRTNTTVWSEYFDRRMSGIFSLHDEISLAIVNNLKLELMGGEREKLKKQYTGDVEAHNLYLRGRWFWNKWTADDIRKAIEYFRKAIEKDSTYALAYAGLADAYGTLSFYAPMRPEEAYPVARKLVDRALDLDPELAEAHTVDAYIKSYWDWDWEAADRSWKKAIRLNPKYITAHHLYAYFLVNMGRFEEALAQIKTALALDPLNLIAIRTLGDMYYHSRQYEEAIPHFQKVIEMDPAFNYAHLYLGSTYRELGLYDEASAAYRKEISLQSGSELDALCNLGILYGRIGKLGRVQEILNQLHGRAVNGYVPPTFFAWIHFAMSDLDTGFTYLEEAYEKRDIWLVQIKTFHEFDPIRQDPRYVDMLKRLNLD